MTRATNTQECLYFGRKLGNIGCDDIETSLGYVVIGSDNDDEIRFDIINNEFIAPPEMIKERVLIKLLHEPDQMKGQPEIPGHNIEIDLEDVIRFAAKNCRGILERVLKETK